MFLAELKSLIVTAGAPTGSVFTSSTAKLAGDGPLLSILDSGGSAGERTQNEPGDAYERPSAQLLARAKNIADARALLRIAYDALVVVRNREVSGVWYVEVRPLQSNFIDLGVDEVGRARVAFNVLGYKRPS